jgi:tetratricopeptide (TPR) repeat protein
LRNPFRFFGELPEPCLLQLSNVFRSTLGDPDDRPYLLSDWRVAGARQHVRDYPENCNYAYRLAGVQERVGDLDGALESLAIVLRRCPDYREAVTAAAAIDVSLGRRDRAARVLERWLDRHPDDNGLRAALGRIQSRTPPQ